jgi:hypothetical protein
LSTAGGGRKEEILSGSMNFLCIPGNGTYTMNIGMIVLIGFGALLIGGGIGYLVRQLLRSKRSTA